MNEPGEYACGVLVCTYVCIYIYVCTNDESELLCQLISFDNLFDEYNTEYSIYV